MWLNFFSQEMVLEIVLNNETIWFSNIYIIYLFLGTLLEKKLSLNVIFVFWTKLQVIRYQRIKQCFVWCFKWSRLIKMHITYLLQKVGWLGAKEVALYPWDSRINHHKWHRLCSTLECWQNIHYLCSQLRLGV
jgi:hypothetical protein